MPEQLDESLRNPENYFAYFNSAQRKGYSGVAIFSREEPLEVTSGFGIEKFDAEGRAIQAEFKDFILLNIYFPNGQKNEERLQYKLDFYKQTMKHVEKLKAKKKSIITCGDYNTAHRPIDLARPKENENTSGFLPAERAWLDEWVASGQIDIFRKFCDKGECYTWWDQKSRARDRNVGWRIDYHFITEDLAPRIKNAEIHSDIMGSDHCPVSIELKL